MRNEVAVSALVTTDLFLKIQSVRANGATIHTVSDVVRAALIRGLAQLETERAMGRGLFDQPVPMTPAE